MTHTHRASINMDIGDVCEWQERLTGELDALKLAALSNDTLPSIKARFEEVARTARHLAILADNGGSKIAKHLNRHARAA